MTPGSYLALRRVAAGRTIEEVALATDTFPAICLRDRIQLIADIEADRVPISANIVLAISEVYAFDRAVLLELVLRFADPNADARLSFDICRRCGCSWHDACLDEAGHGCAWHDTANTLCTACVDRTAPATRLPDLSAAPHASMPPAGSTLTRGAVAVGINLARALRFGIHAPC